MIYIGIIIGIILGLILYRFVLDKTENVYNGSVRIKQKGRNNVQENKIKAEISGSMTRRQVIKLWKSLKKQIEK